MSIWSLGVNFTHISLFSSSKVIKVKKATVIAGAAFLHCKLFIFLKVLFWCPEELFKPPLTQNGAEKWRPRILKAKMCDEGQKIEENGKFL